MNELIVFAGDHSNKELMSVLLVISAAVIVLLLFLKRRNGRNSDE